jgi:hypothetical protein
MRGPESQIPDFRFQRIAAALLCALLFACEKPAPPTDPSPPIVLLQQYRPGFDFARFADAEHLRGAPVREAAASTPTRRDLVYFGAVGNLHVSVKRDAEGREVLSATPFIVPGALTAEERLAKWDSATNRGDGMRGRGPK